MLCSKQRYSFEWKNGKTPGLTKNGKSITCTMDNFVFLAVPGLSSIPAAVCLQHRDQRISEIISENWDCYQIQSRSEVTSMHAGNRCWQILTSRPQDTVNQHTKHFSNGMYKEDPTQGVPDWLRTFLWKRDLRSGRWCFKSGDTKMEAQHSTHFRKYLKRSVPRTEEIGDLTTAERKSECRNNNQQFAAVVQDLTTQWILPVWNQNFTGDGEEFYGSFQSRHRSQKLFIRTIYYNLESRLKNYHGIIEQPHLVAQKQAKLQNELYVEQKKGHQPYYCNLDWLKSCGQIPWNGITFCRMSKTSWQTGNLKMNEDLVNHSKDQFFIWRIDWISQKTPRDERHEFFNLQRNFYQESC